MNAVLFPSPTVVPSNDSAIVSSTLAPSSFATSRSTMPTQVPAALASDALVRRLRELAGDERAVQVDFLLHLDEFDRRRAFLDLGYDSLWTYCLQVLHLREGAAGRRINAMRVLRRFPALEAPLRDGRLCLSTAILLGPLLSAENLDELVSRAAFKTKADVEHLVASIHPRVAPKDGIRKVPQRNEAGIRPLLDAPALVGGSGVAGTLPAAPHEGSLFGAAPDPLTSKSVAGLEQTPGALQPRDSMAIELMLGAHSGRSPSISGVHDERPFATPLAATPALAAPTRATPLVAAPPVARAPEARRQELRPVSAEEWSLRVTMSAEMKSDLETLKCLLSHETNGDLSAVLHEAIRCAIEKHGKRKGAVKPTRARAPAPSRSSAAEVARQSTPATPRRFDPRSIDVAVRREVWLRDRACCSWIGEDGKRCGSTWKLEFDHITPAARLGPPTVENLRLVCRAHNMRHAEKVFGREHMARFTRANRATPVVATGSGGSDSVARSPAIVHPGTRPAGPGRSPR